MSIGEGEGEEEDDPVSKKEGWGGGGKPLLRGGRKETNGEAFFLCVCVLSGRERYLKAWKWNTFSFPPSSSLPSCNLCYFFFRVEGGGERGGGGRSSNLQEYFFLFCFVLP